LLPAYILFQGVIDYQLKTGLLESVRFLAFPRRVDNDEHGSTGGHIVRPSIRVVNGKGDDKNPFQGVAFLAQTILDHDGAFYERKGVVFRQMPVIIQSILNDSTGIRIGDADYYSFRPFPGHTKISQMFQMKGLKSTMDHTKLIPHCFFLNL
jgi:hypothetical protein